jgi:hypothetical protein
MSLVLVTAQRDGVPVGIAQTDRLVMLAIS